MRRSLILIPLLLIACGTPQERCIQRETRDLRTVDRLIAETETNIDRGYALEDVTIWTPVWTTCPVQPLPIRPEGARPPPPRMCLDEEPQTVQRPKAINLAEEREKLLELKKKKAELELRAQAAIAQCRAVYPE